MTITNNPIVDLTPHGYPNYGMTKDKQIYSYITKSFMTVNHPRIAVRVEGKYKQLNIAKTHANVFGTEIDDIPPEDKRDLADIGYPGYILLRDKRIWSKQSLQYLNYTTRKLSLFVNNTSIPVSLAKIYRTVFEITIKDIPVKDKRDLTSIGYCGYWITRDGKIWNDKEQQWFNNTGNRVAFSTNNIKQYSSVSVILAKVFKTPIDKIADVNKRSLDFLGFPNYTVTKDGRVWSHNYHKWMVPIVINDGYLVVKLMNKYRERKIAMHRLVGLAFIPNPENKPEINHIKVIDGVCDKTNNNIENLEWCTHKENIDHAVVNELMPAVITAYQAHEICKLLEEGVHYLEIAKLLNVSDGIVHEIKRKNTWKHISKDYTLPELQQQTSKQNINTTLTVH